jgi:hypothetical protein
LAAEWMCKSEGNQDENTRKYRIEGRDFINVVECLLERKLERHGSRDALLIKERAKAFGP